MNIDARALTLSEVRNLYTNQLLVLEAQTLEEYLDEGGGWTTDREEAHRELYDVLEGGKFALVNGDLFFYDTCPNRSSNPGPTVYEGTSFFDRKTGTWSTEFPDSWSPGSWLVLYALWGENPEGDLDDIFP